jgi:hypothetical protein
LKTLSDELEQELGYYVKLFLIMYADDTALLAESASNLQNMLNLFHEYCLKMETQVNIDKENRKGYKISLCLTPFPQVKKSEYSLLYIILDFTL